ncbi:hypothetical protein G3A_10790 [Bacillus sp. 17376]|nr:hypothetical protein G3A_10790 [Bacillus sp. 17376]
MTSLARPKRLEGLGAGVGLRKLYIKSFNNSGQQLKKNPAEKPDSLF